MAAVGGYGGGGEGILDGFAEAGAGFPGSLRGSGLGHCYELLLIGGGCGCGAIENVLLEGIVNSSCRIVDHYLGRHHRRTDSDA